LILIEVSAVVILAIVVIDGHRLYNIATSL